MSRRDGQYCTVTEAGIAHLVLGFDYGAVCVCGRKFVGFTLEDEEPRLQDVPQPAMPLRLSVAYAPRRAVSERDTLAADSLLARGADEIRRARRACADAQQCCARAAELVKTGPGASICAASRQRRTSA